MRAILDSRSLPPEDRYEAFRALLSDFLVPPTRLEKFARAEGTKWQATLGGELLQGGAIAGLMVLANRPRPCFDDSSPERVSLGVIIAGDGPTSCRSQRDTDNAKVRLIDMTSKYVVQYLGFVRNLSFEIDCAKLGLSVDTLRAVVEDGFRSPLHGTFRRHLIDVAATVDSLPQPQSTRSASQRPTWRGHSSCRRPRARPIGARHSRIQ